MEGKNKNWKSKKENLTYRRVIRNAKKKGDEEKKRQKEGNSVRKERLKSNTEANLENGRREEVEI